MLRKAKKTKHTLLVSLFLSCLCPLAAILVVSGFSLFTASAVYAQEGYPDPVTAAEAILDGYDPGVPLATGTLYNHFVANVTGSGSTTHIDYWTPKKGGTIKIQTNPVDITRTVTVSFVTIKIHILGTIEIWK